MMEDGITSENSMDDEEDGLVTKDDEDGLVTKDQEDGLVTKDEEDKIVVEETPTEKEHVGHTSSRRGSVRKTKIMTFHEKKLLGLMGPDAVQYLRYIKYLNI